MPRRSHKPDPTSRRQVEAMAGYGVPEADIAGVIGLDPKTLRKHYRSELDHGHTKANAKVAENLYRKATGDGREAVIAAIFWLKTRAGWKETSAVELGGSGSQPLTVEFVKIQGVSAEPVLPLSPPRLIEHSAQPAVKIRAAQYREHRAAHFGPR